MITYTYSTLNKITQFWLAESSTINSKLYSVGVPIKTDSAQSSSNKCKNDLLKIYSQDINFLNTI